MLKTCLKCGHPNHQATGVELEPCPSCGAIYSRVESAWRGGASPGRSARPVQQQHAAPAIPLKWQEEESAAGEGESLDRFADRLRAASLYPTFRSLVRLLFWVTVIIALVSFTVGAVAAMQFSGAQSFGAFILGLLAGLFWLIVAKVSREVSMMLADLADAAVRIASKERP